MRTPATVHVVQCSSKDGCLADAVVTMPCPGNEVKGYCIDHISELHAAKARKTAKLQEEQMLNDVLAELGLVVA